MDIKKWDDPSRVVGFCSAGAMLRGVLHGMSRDDVNAYNVTRNKLVNVPNGLSLLGPTLGESTESTSFYNKNQLDAFNQSVRNTEISVGAKLKFKGLFEWAGIGGDFSKKTVDEQSKETKQEYKFYSEVEFTTFAVASVQFKKQKLRLSDEAIEALEKIDRETDKVNDWRKDYKRRHLYNQCTDFIKNFGSHINCGLFHLGGILTKTATFEGSTKASMENIKRTVSTALTAHADVGYSGVGINVSVGRMKADGKIQSYIEEDLQENTKVLYQKYGGRPITQTFSKDDWKNKLREESMDWVVIDRGDYKKSDHVGVWDLLPKDRFSKRQRTRLHNMLYLYTSVYIYRESIYRIIAAEDRATIHNALMAVAEKTKGRYMKNGVIDEWVQLLQDDENVRAFLRRPNDYLPNIQTENLNKIKESVEQLLGYVGDNDFPQKQTITSMTKDISERINARKLVTDLVQTEASFEELQNKVHTLLPGEWLQILREDEKILPFLIGSSKVPCGKAVVKQKIAHGLLDPIREVTDIQTRLDKIKNEQSSICVVL